MRIIAPRDFCIGSHLQLTQVPPVFTRQKKVPSTASWDAINNGVPKDLQFFV